MGWSRVSGRLTVGSLWQLRVIQIWSPDSFVPLLVKINLRLANNKLSTIYDLDWRACDQHILNYTQARCIVIGLHSDFPFADDTWEPMEEANTQFFTDRLLLSYAAHKISFARPIDGEWDLRTKEEKEKDRVVRALMKMTNTKKEKLAQQLMEMEMEMEIEKKETKYVFTSLIEMLKEDQLKEEQWWEKWERKRKLKEMLGTYDDQSREILRGML